MVDIVKIQEKLRGLVAVRTPYETDYNKLSNNRYIASSGLYLDDVEFFNFKFWVDNFTKPNASNNDYELAWEDVEKGVISNVINQVFDNPSYIDRQVQFINPFEIGNIDDNLSQDTFYGYKIELSDKKNVAVNISRVIIEAIGTGDFTIALYANGHQVPVMTKDVTFPTTNMPFEVVLDWNINNSLNSTFTLYGSSPSYKGAYWIGILPSESLNFQPMKRDYEVSNVMSVTSEMNICRTTTKVNPMILSKLDNVSDHNGLNFDFTVYEDFTDLVIQNKALFAKCIQLNWAMSVMLNSVASTRSNRNQRVSNELVSSIMLAIDGNKQFGSQRVVGLREQMAGELGRIKIELDKLKNGYFPNSGLVMDTIC